MNKIFAYSLVVLLIFAARPCLAGCPDPGLFFEKMNPARKTWKDLYSLFKTYQCDEGVYAKGYSDFTAQSLAKHWERFGELASFTKYDFSFKKFVLKHIDAACNPGDLELILTNVRAQCPAANAEFCKAIEKSALSALGR